MENKYQRWLKYATEDAAIVEELLQIKGDFKQIEDRFYRELAFGTGGLRGVIGAGDNRINIYTVRKASQGLSDYLNQEHKHPSIAIAYDSRKNSELFAQAAAGVFAANGIKVHIYRELMPTPMLSFAVRELQCSAGIVVTASHNPAKYNGYKVYGADGCQITLEAANQIIDYINKTDLFFDVKTEDYQDAFSKGKVCYIEKTIENRYYSEVLKCSVSSDVKEANLKVVYSPLNGAGNKPVRHILAEIGVNDVIMVKEQELPDPSFTTCPYPNPEIEQALALGLNLAKKEQADILLATDPDCDRVGTAVKHKDSYVLVNGNQMGVLLFDFICKMRNANNTMPKNPFAIKTIVTSEMAQAVADAYQVQLVNVLTGFKFIGEQIGLLEQLGQQDRYIFGFEESYGYLSGSYVRDKDAVNASMLICEMTAYYKKQEKTLIDVLEQLYQRYGFFFDRLESLEYEGAAGMQAMSAIMEKLRATRPLQLAGKKVLAVCDYLSGIQFSGETKSKLSLPSSDVIALNLEGGSSVVVRPSGTEPKLKVYYSLKCTNEKECQSFFEDIKQEMNAMLQ